jgi:phage gp36-like protein
MLYATAADMLARFDARVLGDLVNDTDSQVDSIGLQSDAVLLAMLGDASGDIEAALLVGGRYTIVDLEALASALPPTNGTAFLKRMCCDITLAYLLRRRPSKNADSDKAAADMAERHLDKLRGGDAIFPLDKTIDATEPELVGMRLIDFQNMGLIRDRTRNYFPHRYDSPRG